LDGSVERRVKAAARAAQRRGRRELRKGGPAAQATRATATGPEDGQHGGPSDMGNGRSRSTPWPLLLRPIGETRQEQKRREE
jgi:hypothetical protein